MAKKTKGKKPVKKEVEISDEELAEAEEDISDEELIEILDEEDLDDELDDELEDLEDAEEPEEEEEPKPKKKAPAKKTTSKKPAKKKAPAKKKPAKTKEDLKKLPEIGTKMMNKNGEEITIDQEILDQMNRFMEANPSKYPIWRNIITGTFILFQETEAKAGEEQEE